MKDFYSLNNNSIKNSPLYNLERKDNFKKLHNFKEFIKEQNIRKIAMNVEKKQENKISSMKLNLLMSNYENAKSKFDINKIFSSPNISENIRNKISKIYSHAIDEDRSNKDKKNNSRNLLPKDKIYIHTNGKFKFIKI